MKRWYVGSISGDKFQSSAKKGAPRRKLDDGRVETGVLIDDPDPNPTIEAESDIELTVSEDPPAQEPQMIELEDILSPQEFDSLVAEVGGDPVQPEEDYADESKRPDFEQSRQPPKTTLKDQDKMQHMVQAAMSLMSPKELTKEEKIQIIAMLWSDVTDVRVQTHQTVLSTKHYAMIAGILTIAVLLKGNAGFKLPSLKGRQTKITDAFEAMDRDDQNQH